MSREAEIVLATLARRRSVRQFSPQPLPEEIVQQILEAGRKSQSADNRQPWRFVVLRENRALLADLFRQSGFTTAPLLLAAFSDRAAAWKRHRYDDYNYAEIDTAIAVTEMITAATAYGVGSCWIASIDPDEVKKRLGVPAELFLVGVIAFGYPPEELKPQEKKRKAATEIFHFEKW